nr:Chain I, 8-mer peptide from Lactotransferrin [Homo sapiens]2HD4_B Chain B, 8-mer Peptide from Lactotransferrin [synthetic construct]
GDEQGENK